MSNLDRTKIQVPDMGKPHVVIVGAGASFAAFPNGEKNGRRLPLMNNIVEILNLQPLLTAHGVDYQGGNFELLYSSLATDPGKADLLAAIESAIYDYFSSLQLLDQPTLYDHLVLSLRDKDIIATFNWDPFIWQACVRNRHRAKMPLVLYLHGNTGPGFTRDGDNVKIGPLGSVCASTGTTYEKSKLLYPVAHKDYSSDHYIHKAWDILRRALKAAYVVTVFGYSAPASDVEAKKLLKEGWGEADNRPLEEIEMIDIKPEDDLVVTWEEFIHTHHYRATTDFYTSIAGLSPRRTCEAVWQQLMEAVFTEPNPIPRNAGWDEIDAWLSTLLDDEAAHGSGN